MYNYILCNYIFENYIIENYINFILYVLYTIIKMKICLVGPGIMNIPTTNWGAVEILLWDYYNELKNQFHQVTIINKLRNNQSEQENINSKYCIDLINDINSNNYDFVHIHYDILFHISEKLICPKIGLTSHYPYINNEYKMNLDGFKKIFNFMVSNNKYINYVLADKDIDYLIENGSNPKYIRKLENGINSKLFTFTLEPKKKNRTIYLGKIDNRKCQYKYQSIADLDFVGPICCNKFDKNINYIGIWSREEVYKNLTDYSNLLLLSEGEADPLVVKEAFMAGLGVVLNETSSKNLEKMDFITIIPNSKLDDINYIMEQIEVNRNISLNNREKIKKYGTEKYDISIVCKKYVESINIKCTSNTTIVTAFFDINREKNGDGRKICDYLEWIKKTLQLNCDLYIVTEKKFIQFIENNRPKEYNTHIKEDVLENASYYKYLPKIKEIIESNEYKKKIMYPNRVECVLPEYNIIQYSKFGWLEKAIQENPFNSTYFFWMDIGISRFFSDINLSNKYPNPQLNIPKELFIAQGRNDLHDYKFSDNFIWCADNLIYGGMFGGTSAIILNINEEIQHIFKDSFLSKKCVNNEQLALGILYNKKKELFHLVSNKKCQCDVLYYLYGTK